MHKLIAIGFTSDYNCYLDIDKSTAIERWRNIYLSQGAVPPSDPHIIEFEFEDEFLAYEVGSAR